MLTLQKHSSGSRRALVASLVPGFALALIAMVYLSGLASTVQTGDTGELVSRSYFLRIVHPSGYPLYVWLQFLATHLLSWGSVFFRASLLNSLCALGALGFLIFGGRDRFFSTALALCLGFSNLFWKYAELPDVFALNSLLAAAMIHVCSTEWKSGARKAGVIAFLAAAGLGNHLSFAFVLPLALPLFLKGVSKRSWISCLLLFAIIFFGLYGSLLLMHPENSFSWGELKTVGDLLGHFLREDYSRHRAESVAVGHWSFISQALADAGVQAVHRQVSAGSQFLRECAAGALDLFKGPSTSHFRSYAKEFGRSLAADFIFPVFAVFTLGLTGSRRYLSLRNWNLLLPITLVYLYAIFSLVKITPTAESLMTVERFFILPELLLCFLMVQIWDRSRLTRQIRALVIGVVLLQGVAGFARNRATHSFAKNTIVEDYAVNLLNAAPGGKPVLLLASDDTRYFALQYVQQFQSLRPDVFVVSVPLLFHPWYSEKIRRWNPAFVFDSEQARSTLKLDLEQDVFKPNFERFSIFADRGLKYAPTLYLTTYRALGREISPGQGARFDGAAFSGFQFRSPVESLRSDPSLFDPYRSIFAEYAYFNLAEGLASYRVGDLKDAAENFSEALKRVPYCVPAFENLCVLKARVRNDTASCRESLAAIEQNQYNYYR